MHCILRTGLLTAFVVGVFGCVGVEEAPAPDVIELENLNAHEYDVFVSQDSACVANDVLSIGANQTIFIQTRSGDHLCLREGAMGYPVANGDKYVVDRGIFMQIASVRRGGE